MIAITDISRLQGCEFTFMDVELLCNVTATPWCIKPVTCLNNYYRHNTTGICVRCTRKCVVAPCIVCLGSRVCSCWVGFVLAGQCTQQDTPVCLKIGRDISEDEARKHKPGSIVPPKQ